ncbi:UNVERIFIED_CONTAM: hypothetical protein FKN15_000813 [Acipenser sinensis]
MSSETCAVSHLLLFTVPAMQPPQSYSVGGPRSSGQLTGRPAGARLDYRGRWCVVVRAKERLDEELEIKKQDQSSETRSKTQQHPET